MLNAHLVRASLGAATTALLALGATSVVAPAGADDTDPNGATRTKIARTAGNCDTPLLRTDRRAGQVARQRPQAMRQAARVNHLSPRRLNELAEDETFWLDECGKGYYVEEAGPERARTAVAAASPELPTSQTFQLESRPGSQRTIYLDFNGGTLTGTAWNASTGIDPIAVAAYSIDADPAFSAAEHAEIQATWRIVAEDFAAFDVNVTTMDPGLAAIDRTSTADLNYGTVAMVTDGGPAWDACSQQCSGRAYLDVFATTYQHQYYQPALMFTNGAVPYARAMGQTISHEVGHNFGLGHDGIDLPGNQHEYYAGVDPWGPLMGSPWFQAVTHWSSGEYPGATNREDDVDKIARYAPRIPDDHGNNVATVTPLAPGAPLRGTISTRLDVDAFTFTGSGATTVTLSPSTYADLDTQLVVKNASGATVATVNPPVARIDYERASGMGAVWSADLPSGGATYRLYVDGIGSGAPSTEGKYSDYASLGDYQIEVTTTPAPLATRFTGANNGAVNRAFVATPVSATNGTAPYTFSAVGLPPGLAISAATGRIAGTPTTAGSYSTVVRVTDATGAFLNRSVPIVIRPVGGLTAINGATPRATVGTRYSVTPATGVGGTAPYSYSATGLPAGVSIDSSTGRLTGIPTTAAAAAWTITVTDNAGATVQRKGTLGVASAVRVSAITVAVAPRATATTAYAAAPIQGVDGYQPYTYSATGLPAGLTIDAGTGEINGTPTTPGTRTVTVRVTDARGISATRSLALTVDPAPFSISYRHFTPGRVGVAYSDRPVMASGGVKPYVYSASGLPPGLSINAGTGFVTGTPTQAGTSSVTVTVADQRGYSIWVTVSLRIDP
ncbi:putative Ig domain-containing protein [Nocardioides antri]|uniref:Dystroglycan-type cadherin-like domain-containing protein n=1 Tax=Nocardioides antri TaxID=2607659 RepID=A0A5B1M185_9ACTN|nr:putative Ig domain-containing protein [Nocardioides antri]KAA1425869.1 hypothetical protein F0U47_16105 [Nocardioides antri]